MNTFKKFFLGIITIISFSTVITLVLLHNDQYFICLKNVYSNFELIIKKIDFVDLDSVFENKGSKILVKIYKILIYFFDYLCVLVDDCIVFYMCFEKLSSDQLRDEFNGKKKFLMNKLMHQSHELNSELIMHTTTVLELAGGEECGQMYWVIQLGALTNFQKVLEVVDKLKAHKYPVYIVPDYIQEEGDLVRIFVGPYSSRESLDVLLDDLYYLSMLRGRIYSY